MNETYYAMKDGQPIGPYARHAMASAAAAGQLRREDWVCLTGQPWQYAYEVLPELFPAEARPVTFLGAGPEAPAGAPSGGKPAEEAFYVMKDGQPTGPFTREALAAQAAGKKLGREDWVCLPRQPWQHAHEAFPDLFPKEVPPEVARALAAAAEKFGVGKKAVGKVGLHVAGVAAKLGIDGHMVKGLDKLSAAAQSALRGTAGRNPRLAKELAEQFDSSKKNLVMAFSYTVYGLAVAIGYVLLFDLGVAIKSHSAVAFFAELLGPLGVFVLLLLGVAITAVRCLYWMFRDEFKAVAIGRKVFLVWIVVSAAHTFRNEIPKATVKAPTSAIVAHEKRSLPAAGPKEPAGPREVLVVDGGQADVGKITWKDWVKGPVKESAEDIWGNYIILALLNTIYNQLRHLRPQFSWANFFNVISFGLWFRFSEYDFDDLGEDLEASDASPDPSGQGQAA